MEKWINFIQTNSEILTKAAIVALSLLILFYLARILRQIKRLNRSLGSITENIQAYFDVILQEEEPKMQKEPEEEVAVAARCERGCRRTETYETGGGRSIQCGIAGILFLIICSNMV